ncbi:MAG: ATP-dependent helicase, partial [Deltaproteobacteria bacterium]|nr:ATP-dependent helicase [Deltaproteobacteria bacterium]
MDLSSLTPSQEKAVKHRGGPLIVLAGPGTGKTRTLTFRIAYLIAGGIARPEQILAVTFTNKASEEMRSRINQLGQEIDRFSPPWISTFHGLCFRFLQENFSPTFQLLSENEALAFLRGIVREQFPDFPTQSLKELAQRISWAKNSLILPDSSEALPHWETYPHWPSCYRAYQEKIGSGRLFDFDELLTRTVSLLEKDTELRISLQTRLPYFFIDEFQDINPAQYRLFQLLTRINGEWMVIGDPNQAIYGFRGANAVFFSHLQRECPNLTEITLPETFRLNQTVLAASSQVIESAIGKHTIGLISGLKGEPSLKVAGLSSAEEEGEYITRIIEEEMGGLSLSSKGMDSFSGFRHNQPRSFADFAVLYRLHAQGELLAKTFSKQGIPYKKIQEVHWVERPEIRACLTLLRALPSRDISPGAALEKIFLAGLSEVHPPSAEGVEAVKKLRLWAATFKGPLQEFIEVLSIQTGLDTYEPDQETVKLLTLHASKGLEFPIVIIAGCKGNLLPLTLLKESDPEEERRLFYVGLTRAKEKVMLTWAKNRTLFGRKMVQVPSPFLKNIQPRLIEQLKVEGTRPRKKPGKKQL